MEPLATPDSIHLRAAEGWLELGNHLEANEELERISPQSRSHPDVLDLHWEIYARAKQWDACFEIAQALTRLIPDYPRGWIALAQTHYFRGEYQQAYDLAVEKAGQFPKSWHLLYDTACYCCQVGKLDEAEHYLHRAMAVGDAKQIKLRALEDPDLAGLWKRSA